MYLHLLFGVFCKRQTMDWALPSYQHTLLSYTSATATSTSNPLAANTSYDLTVVAGVKCTITVSALTNDIESLGFLTLITCHTHQMVVSCPAVHDARQLQLHTLLPILHLLRKCCSGYVKQVALAGYPRIRRWSLSNGDLSK